MDETETLNRLRHALLVLEMAEHWLSEERERPGTAAPDLILSEVRAAITLSKDAVNTAQVVERPDNADAYIAAAREKWCDDDLEIDDSVAGGHTGPKVSIGGNNDGAWVQAWVWVTAEEAGIDQDEEDEGEEEESDDD